MSSPSKIKSDQYRNWVKGALGLYYLQQGLQDFTNNVSQKHQSNILQVLRQQTGNPNIQCNQCSVRNIYPAHASGKKCIQKNIGKCNCRKKANKHCQVCSYIYDDIIRQHRYSDPSWDVDSCQWCSDHWQIAKCFMTTSTMGTNNSAQDTDAAGLLSIIINARFFQNEIHCQINAPYDDFCLARIARNEILHNSTLQLSDAEVSRYLFTMINVLEDKQTLLNDPSAKKAVESLKQISNDKLVITTEMESKAIEVALKAIDEKTEEALQKIQYTRDQIIADVNASVASTGDIEDLRRGLDDHETRLQTVEKAMSELKIQIAALENEVSTLKNTKTLHQNRLDFLEQKKDMQTQLLDQYKDFVSTDVSPLLPEEDVDLSKVFVPVELVYGNSFQRSEDLKEDSNISSLGDIVFDVSGERLTNIYISGVAGMGKTTFCKAILFLWFNSQRKKECSLHVVSDVARDSSVISENNDFDVIKQFDFLFYVSLRHAQDELFVEKMIADQLLYEDQYDLLLSVLRQEPDKCLVILDGLDEWKPSKPIKGPKGNTEIPERKCKSKYTIITTTRPWKLDNIRPSSNQIDAEIKLNGIEQHERNTLIKFTINELNSRLVCNKHMYIYKFNDEIKRLKLHDICKTPILLKLLVCLWYEESTLGRTYCSIYSSVINVIFKHADERHKTDENFQKLKSIVKNSQAVQLPECFKDKQQCQEMSSLVISLSKLAFSALFGSDRESTLVFKQEDITAFGMSENEIEISKQIGLLSVSKQLGRSAMHRYSCFSFAHKTIQEFLCAVFIDFQYDNSIVASDEIKKKWTSSDKVLENFIILKFLCGMRPKAAEIMFQFMSKVLVDDEEMKTNRMSLGTDPTNATKENSLSRNLQKMTCDCISESLQNDDNGAKFRIVDLEVNVDSNISKCMPCFDFKALKSFKLTSNRAAVETTYMHMLFSSDIPSLKVIDLKEISLSCPQLLQILTQAKHLSHLKLQNISMNPDEDCTTESDISSFLSTKLEAVCLNCIRFSTNSKAEMNMFMSILSKSPFLQHVEISHMYCTKQHWNHFHRESGKWNNVPSVRYLSIEFVEVPVCTFCYLLCMVQSTALTYLKFSHTELIDDQENLPESCIEPVNTEYENLSTVILSISKLTYTSCKILCSAICQAHTVNINGSEVPCSLKDTIVLTILRSASIRELSVTHFHCSEFNSKKGHICRTESAQEPSEIRNFSEGLIEDLKICYTELCHTQSHTLVNFIQNANKLKNIEIRELQCIDREETCLHIVDLSLHRELTNLHLYKSCFSARQCCTSALESLKYYPSEKIVNVDFLSYAPCLTTLDLSRTDSKSITTVIPTLRHLMSLTLDNIDFENEELVLSPLMRNLTDVILRSFEMTVDSLQRFTKSLELLKQPVQVTLSYYDIKQSDENITAAVSCLMYPNKVIIVWSPTIQQNFTMVKFNSKTGQVAYSRQDKNKLSGKMFSLNYML